MGVVVVVVAVDVDLVDGGIVGDFSVFSTGKDASPVLYSFQLKTLLKRIYFP